MDYRYQPYSYMQQMDVNRMPFYMSYPMQNLYLTEMEYEKDMERMKELYPREIKKLVEAVEEACDKMEYEGSLMFDEYPDRFMMEQITDSIYEKVRMEGDSEEMPGMKPPAGAMPYSITPIEASARGPEPPMRGPRNDLRYLIGVLLNNEMYRRRCRHRRCNRWW